MLKAGTNSYITIQEADELIKGELSEKQWAALQENDKEGLLKAAARRIESLRFRGKKHSLFQEMSFPRDSCSRVPEAVKLAQALEAAAAADSQAAARKKLQAEGVASISIGNASESYRESASSLSGFYSAEAYSLLSPYLLGSGAIT